MVKSVEKLLQDAVQVHQQGALKKADALYQKILIRRPRHAETMHMRGVLKFQLGNYEYAERLLSGAYKLDSSNPWIQYHRGDLYRTKGEFGIAEQCFTQALELGAVDGDVYFMLANTQFELARYSDALDNYLKALSYSTHDLDYRLNLANCYEKLEKPDQALQHITIVAKASDDPAIYLQLIELLACAGYFLEASEQISQLPDFTKVDVKQLLQTIKVLLEADRAEDAYRLLEIAITLDISAETQETLALMSGLLVNVGHYDHARRLLDQTISRYEPSAISWFQLGLCEQSSGAFESAAQYHRRALACEPTLGRAAYSLAINGKSTVTDAEVNDWCEQANAVSNNADEKIQFLFAAARTLDSRGKLDEAFTAYKTANDLHHALKPFDPDRWDDYIDSVIQNFSSAYFNRVESIGSGGAGLVFIVGMPRSGSTLLEYQLTRQFGATALGEHPTLRRLFMDLPSITKENRSVVQCAQLLTAEHVDYLRKQYLTSIARHGKSAEHFDESAEKDLIVDKMLGNFLRLGIVSAMFPNARILHCTRDAEATCVSCYTNLFARGLKFTYDLYGLGRAWLAYQRLMEHWQLVLPLNVYDVSYERVVTQPKEVFSEISDFLGIKTNLLDTNLNANAASDSINTASFYQARQPISTTSLEGWKRFDPYLDPLKRGLGR